jgi:hypothetical protein
MTFDSDAFISYAHLDNLPLIEGDKGWVAEFHRALEIRVAQVRGKASRMWRDPKLQGNDYFADVLIERLTRVAVLVSILSPPYVRSEWTRRELTEFQKATLQQGRIRVGNKARLFKVLKTWVPLDRQPAEVHDLLGYEFFRRDSVSGKVRELNRVFGEEAECEFWMKLDDLAYDIAEVLDGLEGDQPPVPTPKGGTVYLAETTMDLKAEHESIRRELQEHGCDVLPASPLPVVESDLRAAVAEQLDRCQLSIHMVGTHLSFVPEGGVESLIEVQNDLAIERASKGGFSRLVWIPSGLQVEDERQRKLVEQLRMNPRMDAKSDLIETSLEGLRTVIQDRLRSGEKTAPQRDAQPIDASHLTHLYLIYDPQDQDVIQPWQQFFFQQGLEVLHPYFEGSDTQIRESHEENLRNCDAVLIHYGAAGERWLRTKLREVQKSAGYTSTRPIRIVGISLAPPKSSQKQCFQTHEAMMIPQWEGFSVEPLLPFLREAKAQLQAGA